MKTIKAIIVITILICLCKTVVAQTSQITYGQDHLSGKLDISGVDYATYIILYHEKRKNTANTCKKEKNVGYISDSYKVTKRLQAR